MKDKFTYLKHFGKFIYFAVYVYVYVYVYVLFY